MNKTQQSNAIMTLKGQVASLRKEINPTIQLSGSRIQTSSGCKVPLRRSINCTYTGASSTNTVGVTGNSLGTAGIPDGARILDFKVTNRTGRRVFVNIPVDSQLCYFGPNGNPSVVTKEVWAPLSRFPTLKVNIPDAITNTIDTNVTAVSLWNMGGIPGATTDTFTVTVRYIDYV